MLPRKKLKVSHPNFASDSVVKTNSITVNELNNTFTTTYFSILPNEVLLNIFYYATPLDLFALSQVADERVQELILTYGNVDFSCCCKAKTDEISAILSKPKFKYVTELNFNCCIYIKPSVLTKLICLSKNIVSLSVVDCGLYYNHIAHIFESCTKLHKFSWDMKKNHQIEYRTDKFPLQIKEMHLYCYSRDVTQINIQMFLFNIQEVHKVWINSSPNALIVEPLIGNWIHGNFIKDNISPYITIISATSYRTFPTEDLPEQLRRKIIEITEQSREQIPPLGMISSSNEDVLEFSKQSYKNKFSSLILDFTDEILEVQTKLIEVVDNIAGKRLKNITLEHSSGYMKNLNEIPRHTKEEALGIQTTLERIFQTCKYISVLVLTTMHFESHLPCKSIFNLKHLKILCIPTCAFLQRLNLIPSDNQNYFVKGFSKQNMLNFPINGLEELASNCELIKVLKIYGCPAHYKLLHDMDMYPLQHFRKLRHLEISSVNLQTCNFLRKIADSCPELTGLTLISIMRAAGGRYVPDLVYLFQKSRNLKFLRINEETFSPLHERFWETIATCENLEGICITTRMRKHICRGRSVIHDSVKQLKHLSLFHLYAPHAPEALYACVKKSMQEHGICYPRIEFDLYISEDLDEKFRMLYHKEPTFGCQHSHFHFSFDL